MNSHHDALHPCRRRPEAALVQDDQGCLPLHRLCANPGAGADAEVSPPASTNTLLAKSTCDSKST